MIFYNSTDNQYSQLKKFEHRPTSGASFKPLHNPLPVVISQQFFKPLAVYFRVSNFRYVGIYSHKTTTTHTMNFYPIKGVGSRASRKKGNFRVIKKTFQTVGLGQPSVRSYWKVGSRDVTSLMKARERIQKARKLLGGIEPTTRNIFLIFDHQGIECPTHA